MKDTTKKSFFARSLDMVEIIGNRLPHPAILFLLLAVFVMVLSFVASYFDYTAIHPITNETIRSKSLISFEGIRWMYTNVVKNFISFPPLGLVLVVMVGLGVAEGSGLFTVLIRSLVLSAPKSLITASLVFAGILSHVATEAGYVILVPLGAMVFHALGRHPMAGLAAAFSGVGCGFGSNFLIGSVDPILAGLSTSAAQIISPDMVISPVVNYYFMFVSGILVVILGTIVTEKIVEPRLGKYEGNAERLVIAELTPLEKKGLKWAALSMVVFVVLLALTIVPENGIFRNPKDNAILNSPFFEGIVIGILFFFLVPGLVYGIIVKTIRNDKDLIGHISKSMSGLGGYIVLVFFAAQFVYFFNYSNLGIIVAIKGALGLKSIGLTGIPLIAGFVILSAFINMFMGSASAKWAIMAPVFIPMFMLLDYHPALTQAAFRIGDSITNPVTPMMSYFALIVTFSQRYSEKFGIGTIISTMLPYTIIFGLFWLALLIGWMLLGLPLGPDGPLYLH